MDKKIKLAPIEALDVARRFVVENFNYNDYQMDDCRITDELYRLIYRAKDHYDRNVEIVVTLDLLFHTISADVGLYRGKLQLYL